MSSTADSVGSDAGVTDTSHEAPLCCIVGPTAAGKSALALALAERRGLVIVSADSRQLYRGFDIGTAKPSRDEQARVPHAGIDVADPDERWSAHRWAQEAEGWLRAARHAGTSGLVVGGTGLYVRTLVQPLDAVPVLDAAQRAALEPILAALSPDELARWCRRLDPPRALLGRTQRLRAVETALLAGVRLSDSLGSTGAPPRRVRYLLVDPGDVLGEHIVQRVHSMIAAGFVNEVEQLRAHIHPDAPAWKASGYGAMRAHVDGTLTLSQATERVIIETRQYAKRQRTWFRHQLPASQVTMVDPRAAGALEATLAWWDASNGEAA
jgi:tRNA dimethylallyltransferase